MLSPAVGEKPAYENSGALTMARCDELTVTDVLGLALVAARSRVSTAESGDSTSASSASGVLSKPDVASGIGW